jgi:hypothetical protein
MRFAPSLALIVAGLLAACSETGMSSFTTGNPFTVFADPGEFEFLDCEQLLPRRNGFVARAQELKLLMDKAEQGTGGAIVNVIAYEADYVTAREQIKVVEETARIKKCNFPDIPQGSAAIR